MNKNKCRIIISEDSHFFYLGIKSILLNHNHFLVHPEPVDWGKLKQISTNKSRYIIISTQLWIHNNPGFNDFHDFLLENPQFDVLCFVIPYHQFILQELINSGIKGFIDWAATPDELLWGIDEIAKGRCFFSTQWPVEPDNKDGIAGKAIRMDFELTKRETEVLSLICNGFTDKEIAGKLFISKRTVDGYRSNLLSKFGTRNSSHMVKTAFENCLLTPVNH